VEKKYPLIFLGVGWIIAGIFGLIIIKNYASDSSNINLADQEKQYPLISKRILMEFPQDVLISFLDLRNSLRKETAGYGNSFGLYFEYLPTGTSININGNNEFHAASLFKLPVVMAYFKHKEQSGQNSDPEITLTKEMIDNSFGDLWEKGSGYKLHASKAVDLALEESDNTAARSLVPLIDKQDFDSVYEGLDIDLNADNNGALLSAKSYSSILKALYFSAVLNKDNSSLILDKLTKTKFPDKLVAGIPSDVIVAHKIGDYNDDKGNEAFMDCGIVYVPRRPYMLCMLSVGDEQTARERMQKISKIIYDFVTSVQMNH
jgi:beta-lactamase class A